MSTSYYAACHTCRKVSDTDIKTKQFVHELADQWRQNEHRHHNVDVLCDVTGIEDWYDKLFDTVMEYEVVKVAE